MTATELVIALTKGRILRETLPLFESAGIRPLEDIEKSRKLLFDTNVDGVKLLLMRGSDVPTYVRFGSADIGVAGKDLILENGSDGFYEMVVETDSLFGQVSVEAEGFEPAEASVFFDQRTRRVDVGLKPDDAPDAE